MIKCPHCGESYFVVLYETTTLGYWTPIYRNGKLITVNNNNNVMSQCKCLACEKEFSIKGSILRGDDVEVQK